MTPRQDLYWIDLADEPENIKREIQECPYSWVVVAKEKAIEEPLGVIHKRDLADALLATPVFDTKILKSLVRQPLVLPDTLTILSALDSFKESRTHAAFIVDEYGTMEGFVTLTDVAEAIAGDMPETHEGASFAYVQNDDGSITVNGSMGMHELKTILGTEAFPDGDYNTAAGLVLNTLKRLPAQGDSFDIENWTIQVEQMDNLRVSRLKFIPHKRLLH
jgi:putative hemolysin